MEGSPPASLGVEVGPEEAVEEIVIIEQPKRRSRWVWCIALGIIAIFFAIIVWLAVTLSPNLSYVTPGDGSLGSGAYNSSAPTEAPTSKTPTTARLPKPHSPNPTTLGPSATSTISSASSPTSSSQPTFSLPSQSPSRATPTSSPVSSVYPSATPSSPSVVSSPTSAPFPSSPSVTPSITGSPSEVSSFSSAMPSSAPSRPSPLPYYIPTSAPSPHGPTSPLVTPSPSHIPSVVSSDPSISFPPSSPNYGAPSISSAFTVSPTSSSNHPSLAPSAVSQSFPTMFVRMRAMCSPNKASFGMISCPSGTICGSAGCRSIIPSSDQAGNLVITEFRTGGNQPFIELYNPGLTAINIFNYFIASVSFQGSIRACNDTNGSNRTPVIVGPKEYAYGVPLAADLGIDLAASHVKFVWVNSNSNNLTSSNVLSGGGDEIRLFSLVGLEDYLNFTSLHSNAEAKQPQGFFPGYVGRSTQLDPAYYSSNSSSSNNSAVNNDIWSNWCVTYFNPLPAPFSRVDDTAGSINGDCNRVFINEVVVEAQGDGQTFIELAGPGGALVDGYQVMDMVCLVDVVCTLDRDGDFDPGERDGVITLPTGTRIPMDGILLLADRLSATGGTLVPNFNPAVDVLFADVDMDNGIANSIVLWNANNVQLDRISYLYQLPLGSGSSGSNSISSSSESNNDTDSSVSSSSDSYNDSSIVSGSSDSSSISRSDSYNDSSISSSSDSSSLSSSDSSSKGILGLVSPAPYPGLASLSRSALSTNSYNLSADFYVRCATPGQPNSLIMPSVSYLIPNDSIGTKSTPVRVGGTNLCSGMSIKVGDSATIDVFSGEGVSSSEIQVNISANSNPSLPQLVNITYGFRPFFMSEIAINSWTWTVALNGQGSAAGEIDRCILISPETVIATKNTQTDFLYAWLYQTNQTGSGSPIPGMLAEVGFGGVGTVPMNANTWSFFAASYDSSVNSSDQYRGSFLAPPNPGQYAYTYRFSRNNGLSWTYCDKDGAGVLGGPATLMFNLTIV